MSDRIKRMDHAPSEPEPQPLRRRTVTDAMGIISPQRLDRLWKDRDPMARQRSSKPAFQSAVIRALGRGATIEAIELSLRANDRQGDGTRSNTENFAKGVCRVLNGGHWEDFMDARPDEIEATEQRASITLGQLQKAVDALRRKGLRRADSVTTFMLVGDERAVLGFSFGPGDDDVIGIPGARA